MIHTISVSNFSNYAELCTKNTKYLPITCMVYTLIQTFEQRIEKKLSD